MQIFRSCVLKYIAIMITAKFLVCSAWVSTEPTECGSGCTLRQETNEATTITSFKQTPMSSIIYTMQTTYKMTSEQTDVSTESVPAAVQQWWEQLSDTEPCSDLENWSWAGHTIWDDNSDMYQTNLEQESSIIAALIEGNADKNMI